MRLQKLLFIVLTLALATTFSGCIVAGASSNGGLFIFPSIGVLFVILILFLILRRR